MSVNDPDSTVSIDFGVTNTFQPLDKFVNTESANNKNLLQNDWDFMEDSYLQLNSILQSQLIREYSASRESYLASKHFMFLCKIL